VRRAASDWNSPLLGDAAVVANVEGLVAAGVHLVQRGLVINAPALHPEPLGVLAVEGRVDGGAAEVVETVGVGRAVRGAERVRAGEHGEVLEVQALGREDLGEQRGVSEGQRKLVGSLRGWDTVPSCLPNATREYGPLVGTTASRDRGVTTLQIYVASMLSFFPFSSTCLL
jgi:hypothetical protein